MKNLVIAGSGPPGLAAAIYSARADLSPLVFEGPGPGGQLIVSHEVDNYPGLEQPLSGMELMDRFRKQAERFGAHFESGVIEHVSKGDCFTQARISVGRSERFRKRKIMPRSNG